ncbi:hypothetical protein [Clostridium sp. BJN0013]
MKVSIWNKQDSINGVEAQTILVSRKDLQNAEEVVLIADDTGKSN